MVLVGINARILDLSRRLGNDMLLPQSLRSQYETELAQLMKQRDQYESFIKQEEETRDKQAMATAKWKRNFRGRAKSRSTNFSPLPLELQQGANPNPCQGATSFSTTSDQGSQEDPEDEG